MGKKSDAQMTDIEVEIVKAELNAAAYSKARAQCLTTTVAFRDLVKKQSDVLKQLGGNHDQAMKNPKYADLDQKLDNKEKELNQLLNKADEYPAKIRKNVQDARTGLASFEAFLKVKEGSTSLPWKKKSLSNSKEFVKKAKADLLKIDVPPMPTLS